MSIAWWSVYCPTVHMYVVCQLHSSRQDSAPEGRHHCPENHCLPCRSWSELYSSHCLKKNHSQGQLSPWASPVCTVSLRHEILLPDSHLKQGQKDFLKNYNLLLLLLLTITPKQQGHSTYNECLTCNISWCKREIVQSVKCCVGIGKYRHRH